MPVEESSIIVVADNILQASGPWFRYLESYAPSNPLTILDLKTVYDLLATMAVFIKGEWNKVLFIIRWPWHNAMRLIAKYALSCPACDQLVAPHAMRNCCKRDRLAGEMKLGSRANAASKKAL
jgi:hypothetical protein